MDLRTSKAKVRIFPLTLLEMLSALSQTSQSDLPKPSNELGNEVKYVSVKERLKVQNKKN